MKYLFLLFMMSAQMAFAQADKKAITTTTEYPDCPPGLCPVAYINLEIFNFHKPRTGCVSGFGLCIRLSAGVNCEYCRWRSAIESNQVSSTVIFEGEKAIWHLPSSLPDHLGEVDTSEFELEDGMLEFVTDKGKVFKVKGGLYPVKKNPEDITIELSLQQ